MGSWMVSDGSDLIVYCFVRCASLIGHFGVLWVGLY